MSTHGQQDLAPAPTPPPTSLDVYPDLSPDAPADEERRQRAVESMVVSEETRERLDRVTRLARIVLGVPISTVTVLDGDRAWFPSSQGVDVDEMPRSHTLCDRTQELGREYVVEDTALDPHLAHVPAVVAGDVRFYAGEPLRDHLGNVVGTLCVADQHPRSLDAEQLITLRDLAAWAEQELVSSAEMSQAGHVQASLLPAKPVRAAGWAVDGMCLPALAVGGDFYDFGIANGVVHVGLGDVMGKGTGAALVGAGVRAALRGTHAAVTAGVDLGVTATQVARSLLPDLERSESFVTLFQAAIDLDDGLLRYIDAGAGLGLLRRADGELVQLGSKDRPFGILPDDHWTEHQVLIAPGDRLLVFSDGILDLLDDPIDWAPEVGVVLAEADDLLDALRRIGRLARDRTPLDDVTAVGVFRDPEP